MKIFDKQFQYAKYLILSSAALAVLFSLMTFLVTTNVFSQYRDATRPNMDLSTASNSFKVCMDPSPVELSLSMNNNWIATRVGGVTDLEQFLITRAQLSNTKGYVPVLRLRIRHDAQASFIRDVTILAEKLGYVEVYVACRAPRKKVAEQVEASDSAPSS